MNIVRPWHMKLGKDGHWCQIRVCSRLNGHEGPWDVTFHLPSTAEGFEGDGAFYKQSVTAYSLHPYSMFVIRVKLHCGDPWHGWWDPARAARDTRQERRVRRFIKHEVPRYMEQVGKLLAVGLMPGDRDIAERTLPHDVNATDAEHALREFQSYRQWLHTQEQNALVEQEEHRLEKECALRHGARFRAERNKEGKP